MQRLGFGVIGCGSIGKHHLKQLKEIERAKVSAACDIDASTLEGFGELAGLPMESLYNDYRELLERDDVDAVVVCLPNRLHSSVTVEALEAGKHVLCEKPMAVNLKEAEKMVEAAEKTGRKLQVGLQNRFKGESQALKGYVERGDLGEIYFAKCGWLRRNGIPGWGSWFTRRKDAGAGPIYDIGVHALDLTLWLMDNFEPAEAYASSYMKFGPEKKGLGGWGITNPEGYYDVEDLASAMIKMENGATVTFEVSWASHIEKEKFFVEVLGDNAGLDLQSATIFTTEDGSLVDKKVEFEERNAYMDEMNHFIDCILKDEEPLTRPEELLGLQRALDMILKSCQENRVVKAGEV